MPERDQVRALKLLTDALDVLRDLERGSGAPTLAEPARALRASQLADEIARFLRPDQGGK